jgi:hypothetical protein
MDPNDHVMSAPHTSANTICEKRATPGRPALGENWVFDRVVAGNPLTMTSAPAVARRAEHNPALVVLGRTGMACYGAVYVIVAFLAVRIAFGDHGKRADQTGALEEIASTSFGGLVLWVLAIGLFAFGLWSFVLATTGYWWREKKRTRIVKRIGAGVRGAVGVAIGVSAIRIVTGAGSGGGSQKEQTFTAKVLALPAGPVLVGLAALTVIGFGVASVVTGVRGRFMKDLDPAELPAGSRRWVKRLGRIGNIAKGVGIVIVGILLGVAAIQSEPDQAGGLDAALRTLAGQPFGPALLTVVAIGFAAFGVFCLAAARAHRS